MHVNKQKVLIADDSEINRALLIEILENQYDIVEAENGVEAITLLSRYGTEFSLLLLDIMMPRHDYSFFSSIVIVFLFLLYVFVIENIINFITSFESRLFFNNDNSLFLLFCQFILVNMLMDN